MLRFKRDHDTGSDALLSECVNGWRIQFNLREVHQKPVTIVGYLRPTLELAKSFADAEILKFGHICSSWCKGWVEC